MPGEQIPDCTGDPSNCRLCSMIRQIFEGFPMEEDPGCERAEMGAADDE